MSKPITYDPNWQESCKPQLRTAAEAVRKIRPGQRIFIGTGTAEPLELVGALSKRAAELPDTEIVHLLTFGDAPYAHRELVQYFRVNSFFIAENVRDIIQEGLGDYTPIHLSDLPHLFDSGQLPLDARWQWPEAPPGEWTAQLNAETASSRSYQPLLILFLCLPTSFTRRSHPKRYQFGLQRIFDCIKKCFCQFVYIHLIASCRIESC